MAPVSCAVSCTDDTDDTDDTEDDCFVRIDYPRARYSGLRRFVPSWRQVSALFGLAVAAVLILFGVAYATVSVPSPNDLATAQTSIFYYRDGKTEIGRVGAQNRVNVSLDQVPLHVQRAVLAAEDRNFYSEAGVSPTGIVRAFWVDITGGDLQGGSTITQQYAKVTYLTQDRTLTRKLKEIVISIKLAQQKSKHEILQDYLNTIYFGRGAYGIQAAAQAYFGKDVGQLTTAEGAVLAGAINAPSVYDPRRNPDKAAARFRYVVDGMAKEGWLPKSEAASMQVPPTIDPASAGNALGGQKGFLITTAEEELKAHGFTEDQLNLSGLRITTTFDKKAEDAATSAVDSVLGKAPDDVHTALVAVQPGDGAVRAMYGGKDYTQRQFNNATQGHVQPGSSFKPYVLVAALEKGIGLRTRYNGNQPYRLPDGTTIENFEHGAAGDYGNIDLVTATQHSVNTVYVQLGRDTGGANVARVAQEAGAAPNGIDYKSAGVSMYLGGFGNGLRPIDQADGYATFAAEGVHAAPYVVAKVTDGSGKTLYAAHPDPQRVIPKDVMADATFAMEHVLQGGTATSAQLAGGRPAAGKTGTTSNNVSAWFCGYTPQLASAVAMFRTDNVPLRNIAGVGEVTGGTLPAAIWKKFMDAVLTGLPQEQFPPPAYVGGNANPGPTSSYVPPAPTVPAAPTTAPPTTTPPTTPPPTLPPPPTQPPPTTSPTPTPTATAAPPGQHATTNPSP